MFSLLIGAVCCKMSTRRRNAENLGKSLLYFFSCGKVCFSCIKSWWRLGAKNANRLVTYRSIVE